MASDKMDYEDMIPGALRALMVTALGEISSQGLDGDHHFYITYHTTHDGVEMPDQLRAQYPETITIVLQHEFWDLVVEDQGFSVSLAFNGVPHQLAVPFDAVIGFADPSVNFGIQFNTPQGERKAQTDRRGPGRFHFQIRSRYRLVGAQAGRCRHPRSVSQEIAPRRRIGFIH